MLRKSAIILTAVVLTVFTSQKVCLAGGSLSSRLSVTASVRNECVLNIDDHMDFGGYVSEQESGITEDGIATVQCGHGTTFSLVFGSGNNANGNQRRVSDGRGHYLPYSLYEGRCSGNDFTRMLEIGMEYEVVTGSGASTSGICGRLPADQSIPAGYYQDSVLVTVSW